MRSSHGLWLSWRRALTRTLHVCSYSLAAVLLLLAVALLAARLWLPTLADHKPEIERFLSEKSTHVVSIHEVRPYWEGLHPAVRLLGLKVSPPNGGDPVLQLGEVRVSLDWLPLLLGRVESPELLRSLILVQPELTLRRLPDGRFQFSGFDPQAPHHTEDSGPVMQWLFSQDRLVVEDAVFHWHDEHHREPPLSVQRVNISLRNKGDRHQLGISAKFPDALCRDCSFIVDITGNPLLESSWNGQIYVHARGLNLATLPAFVNLQLPDPLRGVFDVQLWSRWQQGQVHKVYGTAQVSGLELPRAVVATKGRPVQVQAASAALDWEREGETWRLNLHNLLLQLTNTPWVAGDLRVQSSPTLNLLRLEQLNLHELTRFINGLEPQHPLLDAVRVLDPRGTVHDLSVRIEGPLNAPDDYLIEADVENLSASSYRNFPAASGVNGRVTVHKTGGKLSFRADDGSLYPPTVLRAPLKFQRASGSITWGRDAEGLHVLGRDLRLQSHSGRARGEFSLLMPPGSGSGGVAPRLEIRGRLSDTKLPEVYPLLLETTLPWVQRSVYAGVLTNAEVYYSGPVGKLRREDTKLEFLGHMREGALRYLPDWAPVERVQAEVFIQDGELLVTGSGRIGKLATERIVARVPDLYAKPGPAVRITGQVSGAMHETLAVLRATPQGSRLVPEGLRVQGNGALGLEVNVAVGAPQPLRFEGEYQFQGNALSLPFSNLAAEDVRGSMVFTEAGVSTGRLRLQLLGGDTALEVARDPQDAVIFNATGKITGQGLKRAFGANVDAVTGSAHWRGSWSSAAAVGGRRRLQLEADLQELSLPWPAPLGKPGGAPLKLVATTVVDQPDSHLLDMSLDGRAAGRFLWQRQGDAWNFSKGRIGIGERHARLPEEPGLQIDITEPKLDADAWLRYLAARPPQASADGLPKAVTHIVADIGALSLGQRPWGRLHADLLRGPRGWSGMLRGAAVSGKVYIPQQEAEAALQFDLEYLTVPKMPPGESLGDFETELRPGRLPAVNIRSQSFQVGGRQLGQLSFWAAPEGSSWRIRHLMLSRAETNVFIKGDWRAGNERANTGHRIDLEAEISSTDLGAMLAALGIPDQLSGGKAEIKAVLGWEGGFTDFRFADVNGNIQLSARDGRFLNIKQGAGKLLGLFDIRSIARYLTLDFTGIFGKGYAFDDIDGRIRLQSGNAFTENLAVEGASADLNIAGRAGLAAEDFDLQVSVTPHFREPITTLGWYWGGPAGAAGAWFLQRVFKKQIAKGTRLVYIIKGPWSNPQVEKTVKEPGQS